MENKLCICPVCADIFDNKDIWHCLNCDHHYPIEENCCHNCGLPMDGYKVVLTKLKFEDVAKLMAWDKKHGWRRGVWQQITNMVLIDKEFMPNG